MADFAFERLYKPKARERRRPALRGQSANESIPAATRDEDLSREALFEQATRAPDPGDPLSPALRADLERKFGRDLGHIRVHTGANVGRAVAGAGAAALTRGAHIFLATPAIVRNGTVLTHEITHAVQQGAAPPLRFAAAPPVAVAGPIPRAAPAPAPATAPAGPAAPAQPFDLWDTARSVGGAVKSGIRSTAGAITEAGEDLLSLSREALLGVVRRVAPDFLPMFEGDGIGSFLRKLIERGLRSMFDGLTAPLREIIDVEALSATFRSATEWVNTISGQLAKGDCSGVLDAARQVGGFFRESLQPVVDRIKAISKDVEDFFHSIWESIGLPIMDVLKKIGGEIWDSLKGFVSDLAGLIRRVRGALGSAWQTVKGWLGIKAEDGEGEGGGLWNWMREKATAIGNTISETIRPVAGPLKRIGAVMLLIVPGGQLIGIMVLWPDLKRAFDWVSQKWDDLNLIPRAREELATVIIPKLRDAAEQVGKALIDGADWLLGVLDEFHGALATAAEAAVGILTPLRNLIHFAREKSHALITWAREKLQWASKNVRALLNELIVFMGKVGEALKELIAAVVNPFGIVGFLAGRIWLALPECLKGPIIEFLLDVLDAFIDALPTNPLLGLLWPVMKAALTGFVRRVRNVKLAEKIMLADKIAKIISGQSFEFAIGYLKGIVIGIWEEITSPFRALAAIFDLPEKIKKFLSDLGVSFCEIVEKVRCFLATLAQSVFGRLDDVLAALQEYLENPSKILDLLTCAAQGVLSAAESLGETIADEMLKIFRSSDEQIGEKLGKFTGGIIVQAVISYFTAGIGAGASIAAKVADLLGTVGKAIVQALKFIAQQLGKLIKFVKNFIARIGRAIVKGAKAIFGKMKGFFRKVFAWFKKLFAKLRKRFGRSLAERAAWAEFKAEIVGIERTHPDGMTKGEVGTKFRALTRRYALAVRRPAFSLPFRAHRYLFAGRKKSLLPFRLVGKILKDKATRWASGRKAVNKRLSKLTSRESDQGSLDALLLPILKRYHYKSLHAVPDSSVHGWDIRGSMSPDESVAKTPNVKGLHAGTLRDPIPIHWYKPSNAYLPITIKKDARVRTKDRITIDPTAPQTVTTRKGEQRRVGLNSSNLIGSGGLANRLIRMSSVRAGGAKSFRVLLSSLGFSWRDKQADHARDIAFAGFDADNNLWPLARSINQRAYAGKWYEIYRIEFIKRRRGKPPRVRVEKIRALKRKSFKVIGFAWKPSPNPGGRD